MKAIRGATTVNSDSAEEIKESVKELLTEIKTQNALNPDEIVCVTFSNTSDLHSFYPAKAAREAGFYSAPLFSALEPEIDGALKKCIRVMILTESNEQPKHVYLRGAAGLRRDLTNIINIALDGPAGSGKSTVSKLIAKKLNILCLDTGAMYRACALKCVQSKIPVTDEKSVNEIISVIDITVKHENGVQHTYLDGKDVSEDIRKPEISMLASTVSALGCVRTKMVQLQREIAKQTSCIVDGRDIGTNVLPNAPFKFFLTASPEVRAKRRADENLQKGFKSSYEEVLADVIKRDEQDASRKIAPLKQADDAILVDSSKMSIEQVVDFIINKIQEKV
ncbi:MAG: (d)CMP kinase [Clostridia bacterium]|nr:(d)CMP kinase [Clostridia bacterium]